MKIVGTVVLATTTLVKVREAGANENVLVYGRGNEQLTIGREYEFSQLVEGDKQFKSYKATVKTKVTYHDVQSAVLEQEKVRGRQDSTCAWQVVAAEHSGKAVAVLISNSVLQVCTSPAFDSKCSHVGLSCLNWDNVDMGNSARKPENKNKFGTDLQKESSCVAELHTNEVKIGEEKEDKKRLKGEKDTKLKQQGMVNAKFGSIDMKKEGDSMDEGDFDNKEEIIIRTKSQFNSRQANIVKRFSKNDLSSNQPSKLQGHKPKGKTYRRTRYQPAEVSMNDPKVRKKLEEWHRRDTKSGGLSHSSRMRLDPSRIRLGSDRYSRPRSDRIYNAKDSDDEEQ